MKSDPRVPADWLRRVSGRANGLPGHAIRELMELAGRRPGTIHLEIGEPDFPTPPHVVEAAVRAARGGQTRYTSNAGIPELREALAEKLARVNGYAAEPRQIVVTNGGVQAVYAALLALTDPGDEVLLPDPAWPDYVQMAHLLGTPPRFYHQTAETDYMPSLEELEQLVGPRTRVLVVNSPSNPLGAVVAAPRLAELVAFAERRGLWLISDECYDEIDFDGRFASPMAVAPSPCVVGVYTFSKVYAMTGWRVGYVVAEAAVADTISRVQEPLISCVNAPAQAAALAAITGPRQIVADMRDAYRRRRDRACALLAGAGVDVLVPGGAFYLWIDVAHAATDSRAFARDLVMRDGVAVAPGSAFGIAGEGFVRASLAAESDLLLEGVRRLVAAVSM